MENKTMENKLTENGQNYKISSLDISRLIADANNITYTNKNKNINKMELFKNKLYTMNYFEDENEINDLYPSTK